MRAAAASALAIVLLPALAGCTADGPFGAHHVEMEVPESANYPGLHVQGILDGEGDLLAVDAIARNDGERTYQVESGCGEPWREYLFRAGEEDELPLRKPLVRCDGFTLVPFPPGDRIPFEAAWDGTLWNATTERYEPAPPGDYVWSARFVAYGPSGTGLKRFDLDFPVTVQA